MPKESTKPSRLKLVPLLDNIGVILSFLIVIGLMIGESIYGRYNIIYFLPLFLIPLLYILRFRNIIPQMLKTVNNQHTPFLSFERLYAWITIIVSFAAIPYFLAVMGILVQDTWLNIIFTGFWAHGGLHHGWVGWFFLFEAYFYHRINRLTLNYHNASILFRNGLVIMGTFLFLDDFWYEEVSQGILGWPDIFKALNALLPYSWNWNFLIEICILIVIILVIHSIRFAKKKKHSS